MRSTPRAARRSAVLRPRPRLAPVTSAVLGCVSTRDVLPPPTLCRTPNRRNPTHVVTHHDAAHARPTEETACPGIGDPSGGGGPARGRFSNCRKRLYCTAPDVLPKAGHQRLCGKVLTEQLRRHVPFGHRRRLLGEPVGERGLGVVDTGDVAEVPDALDGVAAAGAR